MYSQIPHPWSCPRDPQILFPLKDLELLLEDLGWSSSDSWLAYWHERDIYNYISKFWPVGTKKDWFWSIGLPFLTQIETLVKQIDAPILIGISGLPGCGKTSFGLWLEEVSKLLKLSVKVISMDDFYLPSHEMKLAMAQNPWNVPRGLPGSHSLDILSESITKFREHGELIAPKFDKSLRDGLGDRSGWIRSNPSVLIVEGWFLGCSNSSYFKDELNTHDTIIPPLSKAEKHYRYKVQKSLFEYQSIWKELSVIWHLKAQNINYTALWKKQQESKMMNERGSALQGKSLENFIRMIQVSIPQMDLMSIKAPVVAHIGKHREIMWIGKQGNEPDIGNPLNAHVESP